MSKKQRLDSERSSTAAPQRAAALEPPPFARRTLVILICILAFALGLRLAYLAEIRGAPDFATPLVDAQYHDYWARALATGDWSPPQHEPDPQLDTTPYFRPPGYPLFLGLVYKVAGMDYVTPRVVQIALGLAAIVLLFLVTRRVYGDPAALVAAGLMSCYWSFIYYEGELLEPAISVPLMLGLVLLLLRARDRFDLRTAALAGVCLGLLAITRPNALLLVPFCLWWLWWVADGRGGRGLMKRPLIVFAIGVAAAILPVTLRNVVTGGEFVLISTNGGINLLIGNNPRSDGEVRGTIPGIGSLDTSFDWPAMVAAVERLNKRRMSHNEVSNDLARRAMGNIVDDPGRALGLAWRKTLLFWGPGEVADNKVVEMDRQRSTVLGTVPYTFPVVLALGLLGYLATVAAWRRHPLRLDADPSAAASSRRQAVVLVTGVILVWYASHLPLAVTSRYRMPVIPLLLVFGGAFVWQLAHCWRARRLGRAGGWTLALLVIAALAHVNLAGYTPSEARWNYQLGLANWRNGDLDDAVSCFRTALEHNPSYGAVHGDLATVLALQERYDEALTHFRRAAELRPESTYSAYNLAALLERSGQLQESRRWYERVIELQPDDRQAQAALQRVIRKLENPTAP